MKNASTLLIALALAATPAIGQSLFHTDFATEDDFSQWTVIDANADNSTWKFEAGRTPSQVFYGYSWQNAADDWLISPEITPTADGALVVKYTYSGSSYVESMEVYTGTEATVDGMTTLKKTHQQIYSDTYTSSILLEGQVGKAFRVGFRATSAANLYNLYLCSVSVEPTESAVDLCLTDIASPTTGDNLSQEDVTINIINEGLTAAEGISVSFAIDGTVIATEQIDRALAPGEEMQYTFQTKADLSAPRQNYTITASVSCDDDIDTSNNNLTTTVRHNAPATVPYTMGFEPDEYTDGITILNLNEDDGNWGVEVGAGWFNMARTGYGYLGYNYNKENAADDWAILEPISITEPGYYALSFWYSGDDKYEEKLAVYYGNAPTPEAMTNKVVEYAPFMRGPFEESVNVLHIEEPQTIYIGFYAFSDCDKNWIVIDDVSLTRIENEQPDMGITSISSPTGIVRPGGSTDLSFTVSNLGVTNMEGTVSVMLDGTSLRDTLVTLEPQRHSVITVEGALAGIVPGEHTVMVSIAVEGDYNEANNSMTHTFVALSDPYLYWDFEDGQLPADITYRSEDGGTPSPSAGDEFNEDGWGLFEVEGNALYGSYVLALTSWLNGTDQADRWMELPAVMVTSNRPYLAWVSASYNASYTESYEVHVLNIDNSGAQYEKVYEETNASTSITEHAVSLAAYEGHNVRIAFRLISSNADCLILDNIGLYGVDVANGIANAEASQGSISVSGGKLHAPQGTVAMAISDGAGRTLRTTDGAQIDLTSLPKGVYIVTTTAANGNKTSVKVAR